MRGLVGHLENSESSKNKKEGFDVRHTWCILYFHRFAAASVLRID